MRVIKLFFLSSFFRNCCILFYLDMYYIILERFAGDIIWSRCMV